MSSPHRLRHDLYMAPTTIKDPGYNATESKRTITIDKDGGVCPVVTTGTGDTRTLRRPTKAGIIGTIVLYEDGGNLTLTVTGGYNEDGLTPIVFDDAGDFVTFISIDVGGTYYWRVLSHEGTDLSTEDFTVDTLTVDTLTVETIAIAVESAAHGIGLIGTSSFGAPRTYRYTVNGEMITDIKIDLTGLASKNTADDVIGLAAGGVAYLCHYLTATHGVVYKIELICLETPTGGDNDINVVANSSALLLYDSAGGTAYGVNGGDAVAGQVVEDLVQGLTPSHYLYLTAGTGDTAATYTAGQFIIRLHGHAELA